MLAYGHGMIVSPTAQQGDKFTPIGAGPFTLVSLQPQQELQLKANPDYWGGAPNLDGLKFVGIAGEQPKVDALKSGGIDAAYLRNAQTVNAAKAEFPGYVDTTSMSMVGQLNNAPGRPAADPRVRQAIAYSIDPEVLNQRVRPARACPAPTCSSRGPSGTATSTASPPTPQGQGTPRPGEGRRLQRQDHLRRRQRSRRTAARTRGAGADELDRLRCRARVHQQHHRHGQAPVHRSQLRHELRRVQHCGRCSRDPALQLAVEHLDQQHPRLQEPGDGRPARQGPFGSGRDRQAGGDRRHPETGEHRSAVPLVGAGVNYVAWSPDVYRANPTVDGIILFDKAFKKN